MDTPESRKPPTKKSKSEALASQAFPFPFEDGLLEP
jgi:hypothetical protein